MDSLVLIIQCTSLYSSPKTINFYVSYNRLWSDNKLPNLTGLSEILCQILSTTYLPSPPLSTARLPPIRKTGLRLQHARPLKTNEKRATPKGETYLKPKERASWLALSADREGDSLKKNAVDKDSYIARSWRGLGESFLKLLAINHLGNGKYAKEKRDKYKSVGKKAKRREGRGSGREMKIGY